MSESFIGIQNFITAGANNLNHKEIGKLLEKDKVFKWSNCIDEWYLTQIMNDIKSTTDKKLKFKKYKDYNLIKKCEMSPNSYYFKYKMTLVDPPFTKK